MSATKWERRSGTGHLRGSRHDPSLQVVSEGQGTGGEVVMFDMTKFLEDFETPESHKGGVVCFVDLRTIRMIRAVIQDETAGQMVVDNIGYNFTSFEEAERATRLLVKEIERVNQNEVLARSAVSSQMAVKAMQDILT